MLPFEIKKFDEELSNLFIKLDADLSDYCSEHGKAVNLNQLLIDDDIRVLQAKHKQKILKLLPPGFVKGLSLDLEDTDFIKARKIIKKAVDEKLFLLKMMREYFMWNLYCKRELRTRFSFWQAIDNFSFNEDSTLSISRFDVLKAIIKYEIPLERVLLCPSCQNIFWAGRTDTKTCSEKCSEAFRTRKSRNRKAKKELVIAIAKDYKENAIKLEKQKKAVRRDHDHPLVEKQLELLNDLFNKALNS